MVEKKTKSVTNRKRGRDWLTTPDGQPRGYIQPDKLTELWFHTGTRCNLGCSFCLEGSGPKADRLDFINLDDARPFIDEAVELGVSQFSFTGGEPFHNPHFVEVLEYALDRRRCLVLTNATRPIRLQWDRVTALASKPNPLQFRVSLDHPNPEKHDEIRGQGNFIAALKAAGRMHELGFGVSIARHNGEPADSKEEIDRAFLPFFDEVGLPHATRIVSFPELHRPGDRPEVPQITENCMTTYKTESDRAAFMCNFSKMVVKIHGRMAVYACTLVDDDPDYELGESLSEAMKARVMLRHHRCFACFSAGASCSEM